MLGDSVPLILLALLYVIFDRVGSTVFLAQNGTVYS